MVDRLFAKKPLIKRTRGGRFFKKEDAALYIMALPAVAALLLFAYAPMFGLVMAFQNLNIAQGVFSSPFIGFKNFEFLFASTDAYIITRNTVLYNLAFIVVNMTLSVVLAMTLSELTNRKTAKVYQTLFMLPHFLSWSVVAIVLMGFLDYNVGLINKAFDLKVDWYRQREVWPYLIVGLNAWKGVGYSTVLYLAVISGISHEYYEAAVIDGASKFQQARYITFPHLRMVISISLIMAVANIFRGDFGLFYVVTKNSGRLYPVTDVIDTYIYRALTYFSNVGMATAASLYQSIVGFVLVLVANTIVTKIDPESAMF